MYLFACPSAAAAFAAEERKAFLDRDWPITRIIYPEPLAAKHRFSERFENCPMEFGPGQKNCRRIRRHIRRWWRERDAWWNQPRPTMEEWVEYFLADSAVGNGFHDWALEGGVVRVTTEKLRAALEAAYDETDPNWMAFVELD